MTQAHATHSEESGLRRTESVAWSHLSIEFGHLYMEDFKAGATALESYFDRLAPWARTAVAELKRLQPRPRVSTCFLVDDYFLRTSSPQEVIPAVREAAKKAGVPIDYLARESACVEAAGVPLAALVQSRLVPDPPAETNGSRPPATENGWLCNGVRSPSYVGGEAMRSVEAWAHPVENGARNHSLFLDVELWRDENRTRTWSCAYLAAVWQLVRLGLLRFDGKPVTHVVETAGDEWPDDWDDVPAVVQLNAGASSFTAYRTFSVMTNRFLPTEHAVRMILGQVEIDRDVLADVRTRAEAEGYPLPKAVVDRLSYVFAEGDPRAE